MQLQENVPLKKYNTFGIGASARYFSSFQSVEDLGEILNGYNNNVSSLILGGGSNLLFTGDYDGLILKNEIKGITRIKEDDDYVYIKTGAGENWHQFVLYCIEHDLAGVENLSLIPGNTGASPMQNIGAYGVEIKDVFHELEAYHLKDNASLKFSKESCEFGYRESVFKRKYKGEFAITSVTFRLAKKPVFHVDYGAIKQELEKMNIHQLGIRAISQAVINIRRSKLPDPAVIGNAGSFFKNPEITAEKYHALKEQYPALVGYVLDNDNVKLAAGWMIEQCGWKGYRKGDAGCHAHQALVLVNYGNAQGSEILELSESIIKSVNGKFGVTLEREVNIIQ